MVLVSPSVNSSPSRLVGGKPVRSDLNFVRQSVQDSSFAPTDPPNQTDSDAPVAPESGGFTAKRTRRRPNQPKKIRPRKRDGKAARQRQEMVSQAGYELPVIVDSEAIPDKSKLL